MKAQWGSCERCSWGEAKTDESFIILWQAIAPCTLSQLSLFQFSSPLFFFPSLCSTQPVHLKATHAYLYSAVFCRNMMLTFSRWPHYACVPSLEPYRLTLWILVLEQHWRNRHQWMQRATLIPNPSTLPSEWSDTHMNQSSKTDVLIHTFNILSTSSISLPEKLEYIANKYAEHSHDKWSSDKVSPGHLVLLLSSLVLTDHWTHLSYTIDNFILFY